ncbi:Centromere/kinetochore protein zw10 [Kappamyces sp. JEL0829]|nr:Centromere/kinetochore protein zw10 [Kappamyces sp. JEL0829]
MLAPQQAMQELFFVFNSVVELLDTTESDGDVQTALAEELLRFYKELQSFDGYMDGMELVGAAASARELKTLLESIEERLVDHPIPEEISRILEEQYLCRLAKIQKIARDLEAEFYAASHHDCRIKTRVMQLNSVRFPDNPVELDDLWSILEALDLSKSLTAKLLHSVQTVWIPHVHEGDVAISNASNHSVLQLSERSDQDIATRLTELSRFISNNIFTATHRPTDDLLSQIEADFYLVLEKHSLKLTESQVLALEQAMASLGRTRVSVIVDMVSESFAGFLDIFGGRHALRERRTNTLFAVKQILESGDANTVPVSDGTERGGLSALTGRKMATGTADAVNSKEGQESTSDKFLLPTMHVSAKIQSIVEIVYSTMNEMCMPANMENAELWSIAKASLDLVRLQEQIVQSPDSYAKSMVTYNDCIYVVHHLCTLGAQFQEYLPLEVRNYCFLDLVPLFTQMGEQALSLELLYQKELIGAFFQLPELEICVSNSVNHIKSVAKVWRLLSATETYLECIGIVVSECLERLSGRLLADNDWDNEFQLQYVWNSLSCLEDLFAVGKTKYSIQSHVTNWSRFLDAAASLEKLDGPQFRLLCRSISQ